MTNDEARALLAFYFADSFGPAAVFPDTETGRALLERLALVPEQPLTWTHLNQLLHLANEAGVSEGFFSYYFLNSPASHPYSLDRIFRDQPELHAETIVSVAQVQWGLHRFFIDALLYFGNFRTAYRTLRTLGNEELVAFFAGHRLDGDAMKRRGEPLPFRAIPADDRYLIAEIACKAYTPPAGSGTTPVEDMLLRAYRDRGPGRVSIRELFAPGSPLVTADPESQILLEFATEEFIDDTVQSEEEIREKVARVARRFVSAREAALYNTRLYLSIVNELDVYVATSMRRRSDFRDMARDCETIFNSAALAPFSIRYFDPTLSAAEAHEDKGLIECLMVKCAKTLLYFAGEGDTFGKDAEAAMALSLGKPVVILCPKTAKGSERLRIFRDVHPLSRLIEMATGVACGAMITNELNDVVTLMERIFANRMEYDLEHGGDGYFRLKERVTGSVVRLQTNFAMLRESFWNYYHGVQ